MTPRPPRLGLALRSRFVLGFGCLAFGISTVFAISAWRVATDYVVDRHEETALVDATEKAAAIEEDINRGSSPAKVLGGLPTSDDWSGAVLYYEGEQFKVPPNLLKSELPPGFTEDVRRGDPQTQQLELSGQRFVVAGVPLGRSGDAYFELFTLSDIDRTNTSVGITMAGTVAMMTLLGVLFGRMVSNRALRPLAEVTNAATAIARGEHDVRLDAVSDPDLGGMARLFDQVAAALRRQVVADARFAGDVGHELRTPLTTMLNSMQLLKNRRDVLPEAVREPVDLLSDELERFRRLVVDLLEISRYDGGNPPALEDVRIGEFVRRVADSVAQRPVTIVSSEVDGLSLRVDRRCLERVMVNLVENAETHGCGCVAVRVMRSRDAVGRRVVRIDVDDHGPGVPDELRDRIFERFSRDRSAHVAGVGLGLAIVKRHVQAHRGLVRVEEQLGGGSRFIVELPVK